MQTDCFETQLQEQHELQVTCAFWGVLASKFGHKPAWLSHCEFLVKCCFLECVTHIFLCDTCAKVGSVAHDKMEYRQVSNIRRTALGNKIVDHSDVVGASPVGAAPTASSFST